MAKERKILLTIIFIALLLRSLVLIVAFRTPERSIGNDSPSYLHPAEILLSSGYYTFPDTLRTPIYPMFLALLFEIFGKSLFMVILVQIILSTFNVILTFFLAKQFLTSKLAFLGAFFLALSLESFTEQFFILTETLFTSLFLGSLLCLLRHWKTNRSTWLINSAILMALSILCRPIALYYPVFIIVVLIYFHWKDIRKVVFRSLIYSFIVAIILLPWYVRSNYLTGKPIISTITNYNLLFYNAASLDADLNGGTITQYQREYQQMVQNLLEQESIPATEANLDTIYFSLAREKILAYPFRYAIVHLKYDLRNFLPGMGGVLEILAPSGQGGREGMDLIKSRGLAGVIEEYFGGRIWILLILIPFICILGMIYIADLIGTISLVKNRSWFPLMILLLPISYFLILPGAPSNSRFRVPVMPYICILAGVGFQDVILFIKRNIKINNGRLEILLFRHAK